MIPGGTTSTSLPRSLTNWSRIWLSFIPACSMLIIFCLSRLHSGQPGCIWQSICCLQPQLQLSFPAMALIWRVSHGGVVCASANTVTSAIKKLTFNSFMRTCHGNYLGAGPNQPGLAGNQANDGAEQHHPVADPNPAHERKHIGVQYDGVPVGIGSAGKVHV